MKHGSVVVLGGGLSGVATAHTLAHAGVEDITLIERGDALGGLAGSFERDGFFYPLGYHHILHRDRPLLYFLQEIGALERVRWRRVRMLFHLDGVDHDLASPAGFLRFPMSAPDKLRFIRLMLRTFRKRDWSDWFDRDAQTLVDSWGGPGVRTALFERLTRLKFELACRDVSGAWLGARLHYREGSAPLGYIPGANWTKVLCDGVTRLVSDAGVKVLLRSGIRALHTDADKLVAAELDDGRTIAGDLFVSTIPSETYLRLVPGDATPQLDSIRYSALISVVCATRQRIEPDFYWMNVSGAGHTTCGIFLLSSLNPSIGRPGDACVNFVVHLNGRDRDLFHLPDEELTDRLFSDFRRIFGFELDPFWINIARVPMYSPVFVPSFRNPPIRSTAWSNVYFAGNYRTFPSIVSTGTALGSGVETGDAVLRASGRASPLPEKIRSFRLERMPRA